MAELGIFYGVGVGPGDPDLITVKGAKVLASCRRVFVPTARTKSESLARRIAARHLPEDAQVQELVFPMSKDSRILEESWEKSVVPVAEILRKGEDACFLTLGDPMLYSTYIYLVRALKKEIPELEAQTIPGIPAFCAAAARACFPVGEGTEKVGIIPVSDDLEGLRRALESFETLVLMKVARQLPEVLNLLEERGLLDKAIYVSRAGQEDERIVTDLSALRGAGPKAGYLSIILVKNVPGSKFNVKDSRISHALR
jgi:precorrin-2/cobalt-factor-2 C20-methyltransferase